eukprot:768147-Hanusia_phi.AAC.1
MLQLIARVSSYDTIHDRLYVFDAQDNVTLLRAMNKNDRTLISVVDFFVALGVYETEKQAYNGLNYFLKKEENCDLKAKCSMEKFKGQGQKETWVADWDTLLDVLCRLKGRVSDAFRAQMRQVYTRFRAGDQTMHADINRNAASEDIGNVLARDALGMEPGRVLAGQELVEYEQAQSKIRLIKMQETLDEKYNEEEHL